MSFLKESYFSCTYVCVTYYVTTYVQANYPIIELRRCIENVSQLNFMHLFKTVSYSGLYLYIRTHVDMHICTYLYIVKPVNQDT